MTDNVFDGNALVPFAHGMGLISDDLYRVSTEKSCKDKKYSCKMTNLLKFVFVFSHINKMKIWFLLQELIVACNGNYYNPVNSSCSEKLAKVDEVRNDSQSFVSKSFGSC